MKFVSKTFLGQTYPPRFSKLSRSNENLNLPSSTDMDPAEIFRGNAGVYNKKIRAVSPRTCLKRLSEIC